MSPQEKATELFDKFNFEIPLNASIGDSVEQANNKILQDVRITKQCALIVVDEILKIYKLIEWKASIDYWKEVKQEIQNL